MRLAALALIALAMPLTAAPQDSAVQIYYMKFRLSDTGESSVVGGWGSGTIVGFDDGKSYVLTNRHVAPEANGIPFVYYGGNWVEAKWVAKDDRLDLALLAANFKGPVAKIAKEEPKVGTKLEQFGFSGRGPMRPKTGTAVGFNGYKEDNGEHLYTMNIDGAPGDSGSMVFNPAGEGMAVCCGGRPGTLFQVCVPLAGMKRFLSTHMPGAPAEWKTVPAPPKLASPPQGRILVPAPCFT